MADWTERELINLLASVTNTSINQLGHYEDAISIKIDNTNLIINIDGWVASTDRPPQISLSQSSYRAIANAASDVIAKGARPEGMIISFNMPTSLMKKKENTVAMKDTDTLERLLSGEYQSQENVEDIISGIEAASSDFNIPYLGGDINKAEDLVLDVTIWGKTDTPIRRDTASVGEQVCWLGPPLGCTAAALGVLVEGWKGRNSRAIEIMGSPDLYTEFLNIPATAAIDCSDGLARSLHLLSDASEVGFELNGEIMIDPWVNTVAQFNDVQLTDLILYGGEELGVVFTCTKDTKLPDECIVLGKVIEETVVILDGDPVQNKGWEHFT